MNLLCRPLALVSICLATLLSCNKKENKDSVATRDISGQLFVIQKNRINVKLGGVEVTLVPRSEFRERCAWIASQRDVSRELRIYKRTLEDAEKWLNEARDLRSVKLIRPFLDDAEMLTNRAWKAFDGNPLIGEHEDAWYQLDSNRNLFSGTEFQGNSDAEWTVSLLFFDWLSKVEGKKATTDADGNFRLPNIPEAGGYLIAMSSRQFGTGDIENYYWIKEINEESESAVILSSMDCVDPSELEKLLKNAPVSPSLSQKEVVRKFDLVDLDSLQEARPILRSILTSENRIKTIEEMVADLESQLDRVRMESSPEIE